MPNKDAGFAEYVVSDVLGNLPGIKARAMFGGYGISQAGLTFAIIADGRLYFKVNDQTRPDYETAKSHPFTYSTKNGDHQTMGYWELPEKIIEDSRQATLWAEKSINVAKLSQTKKRAKK